MIPTEPPSFATYLVSSFSIPRPSFGKRHSTSHSASSSISTTSPTIFSLAPSLTSQNTTPSTSPSKPSCFDHPDTLPPSYEPAGPDPNPAPAYKLHRAKSDHLKCSTCATDLAFASQIISKAFTGRHGRAYLVSPPPPSAHAAEKDPQRQRRNLINIAVGKPVSRQLSTGAHVVADITCAICGTVVGWKYVDAKDEGQKYKVGKFILETKRVAVMRGWEDVPLAHGGDSVVDEAGFGGDDDEDDDIRFDSEDEDECDEIFAGTWDRVAVRKRRERAAPR